MARSFYRPAPDNTVEDYTHKNTFYHQASDTHFEMIHVPDHGPGGGATGTFSGNRLSTSTASRPTSSSTKSTSCWARAIMRERICTERRRVRSTELPLGWYAENGGTWAMNPGYDRPDHQGFQRKITYDCMFCHNGYPEIPPGDAGPRSAPIFSSVPEGIDCQRCHGDGEKHVGLARRPRCGRGSRIRGAIVNPSRLTPQRQMEVCMQCHLETTSSPLPASIVRYERGPFSYRPGEPLADFILHFDHAPGYRAWTINSRSPGRFTGSGNRNVFEKATARSRAQRVITRTMLFGAKKPRGTTPPSAANATARRWIVW